MLLHERHHAWRRDPLRLAAGRVVARALFFLPWLDRLHGHELSLAELGADERAMSAAPGNRSALARAMLSFTDASAGRAGFDPLRIDYLCVVMLALLAAAGAARARVGKRSLAR
ncbi:MAG: M48 family metalloprotease [Solirubrobacteraceae bacterium]